MLQLANRLRRLKVGAAIVLPLSLLATGASVVSPPSVLSNSLGLAGLVVLSAMGLLLTRAVGRAEQKLVITSQTDEARVAERTEQLERANLKLEAAATKLKATQRISRLGGWELDPKSGDAEWADELFHIFGLPVSEQAPNYEVQATLFEPESWQRVQLVVGRAMQTGEGYDVRLLAKRRDGTLCATRAMGEAVRDASGKIVKLAGTFQDISQLERVELELERSNTLQRAVLEYAGALIVATDLQGSITAFSRGAETLLGYPQHVMIGKTPMSFHDPVEVEARRAEVAIELNQPAIDTFAALTARARGGEAEAREWTFIRATGDKVPALLTITGMRDSGGKLLGFLGVAVDLTERKKAEAALTQLNRELSARSAQAEVLLQEVHHRVKNNLQLIGSLISLQLRQVKGEQATAALKECQSRVLTIAQIHEQLYQANNYAEIPFDEYASTLAHNVFRATVASAKGVQLKLTLEPIQLTVEQAIPCGLLLNELITNSVKHSFPDGKAGTIEVSMKRVPDGVCLGVCDDGVGLPEGFDPTRTSSLGMQLVTTLARQLRGRLDIESKGGARFTLTFPLA